MKKLFLGDELEENILKDFRREVEVMMYVTVEFLFNPAINLSYLLPFFSLAEH